MIEQILEDAQSFWDTKGDRFARWRGSARWANDEAWFRVGRLNYGLIHMMLSDHSPWAYKDYKNLNVLEHGCGGGANVVELIKHFGFVYGVDISLITLRRCIGEVNSIGLGHKFQDVHLPISDVNTYQRWLKHPIHVFLSIGVYHHFPSKEYGIEVTKAAYDMLTSPGFALIEIRFDDGSVEYAPKSDDYFTNAVTFTSYKTEEFKQICENAGFKIIIPTAPVAHSEYFLLKKED